MTVYGTTVSPDKVKLKYRERYVTEGENERSLAYPSGCYRGFIPEDSTVPDMKIHLNIDPLSFEYDTDSFAVFNRYNESGEGWSLSIRESTDIYIELSGTAFDPIPAGVTYLYVYMYADYAVGQTTDVEYRVSDEDPHNAVSSNYDVDTIVIGRIPVTPAATSISFDISNASTWVDVLTPRTYPAPTAAELLTDLGAGDKLWGYYDSLSAWRTPTVDEKKAMVNANSPDAANPFATMDDTNRMYTAEWTAYDVTIDPTASVDGKQKIALSGDWYIGDGARASDAARYFKVYSKDSTVMGYDASFALDYGGVRPIRVWDTAGTTALTPSSASDTEGFYTDPQLQLYMDTEQVLTQEFTIAGYKKKQQGTMEQAPVSPAEYPSANAQNVSVKRLSSPPLWGETSTALDDERNGLQDVVHDLHRRLRGPVARSLSATNLNMALHKISSTVFHEQGAADAHPFAIENTFPYFGIPFADIGANKYAVRKIAPWRLGGIGAKVIVVGLDNAYPATGGPAVGFVDPSTGETTVTRLESFLPASDGTKWVFQDLCVDDNAIYIRVADDSVTGNNRLLKLLYGLTVDSAWPTNGVLLGAFDAGTVAGFGSLIPKRANVINANLNYLAANDQTTEVNGAASNVGGVYVIRKSDGVIIGNGTGDLVTSGTSPIPALNSSYCSGPIASDGSNIYFSCVKETGGGGIAGINIGVCQIANPHLPPSLITGWYSWYYADGQPPVNAIDLVFDGYYIWGFAGSTVTGSLDGGVTQSGFTTNGEVDVVDMTGFDEQFGPACFDGKDIWHITTDPAKGTVACNRLSVRGGVQDIANFTSTYADLLKETIGICDPLQEPNVAADDLAVGAIAFDGEDVWYTLDGYAAGTGTMAGWIFRIPNVKNI